MALQTIITSTTRHSSQIFQDYILLIIFMIITSTLSNYTLYLKIAKIKLTGDVSACHIVPSLPQDLLHQKYFIVQIEDGFFTHVIFLLKRYRKVR